MNAPFKGPKDNSKKHPNRDLIRRARRISEGEERNAAWRGLTANQKLDSLDERLGFNVGAERQRLKLVPLAEAEKPAAPATPKKQKRK